MKYIVGKTFCVSGVDASCCWSVIFLNLTLQRDTLSACFGGKIGEVRLYISLSLSFSSDVFVKNETLAAFSNSILPMSEVKKETMLKRNTKHITTNVFLIEDIFKTCGKSFLVLEAQNKFRSN